MKSRTLTRFSSHSQNHKDDCFPDVDKQRGKGKSTSTTLLVTSNTSEVVFDLVGRDG
jgi:hypothetical protein